MTDILTQRIAYVLSKSSQRMKYLSVILSEYPLSAWNAIFKLPDDYVKELLRHIIVLGDYQCNLTFLPEKLSVDLKSFIAEYYCLSFKDTPIDLWSALSCCHNTSKTSRVCSYLTDRKSSDIKGVQEHLHKTSLEMSNHTIDIMKELSNLCLSKSDTKCIDILIDMYQVCVDSGIMEPAMINDSLLTIIKKVIVETKFNTPVFVKDFDDEKSFAYIYEALKEVLSRVSTDTVQKERLIKWIEEVGLSSEVYV